ncbi:MAG: type IV pilus modification protein PilV [Gallionellaceae bacterium]
MKKIHLKLQHGSALLEALISILIFSMGILALLGLQAAAIKNSGDAKYRADATYLASQIIGQMWVDRINIATYAHNPSPPSANCAPTVAASTNNNVVSWLAQTNALLPGASGVRQQITINPITPDNVRPVTVTVCWQAPQELTPHNFVVNAQINI